VEALCQPLVQRGHFLTSRGVADRPNAPSSERYAFVHSLYRDALYQGLPALRLRELHRRIGLAIERFHGARASDVAAELATHFDRGHDVERAVPYLVRAADNAARRYAHQDAIHHLTRALELLDDAPMTELADLRLTVLERRGLLRRATGRADDAAADLEALATWARQRGRPDHEAKALFYLASAVFAVDGDRCLVAAQQAVERSRDAGDELFHARTRGSSGYWHSILRGWRSADAHACEEATLAARRTSDRALLSLLLGRLSYFRRLAGEYHAALETAEEGLGLALEVGDAYEYLFCQYGRAQALLLLGRWDEMLRVVAAGSEMASRNGSPLWQTFFRLAAASLHLQASDHAVARDLARHAVADAREIPHPYCEMLGLIVLASAELRLGDHQAAIQALMSVAERMDATGPRDLYLRMPLLHALGEYWLDRADLARARQAGADLWEAAAGPGEPTWQARGARLLARAAAAGGERARARDEIARGLRVLERVEAPLAAWQVDATAAELAEREGDRRAADRAWEASARTLVRLTASLSGHQALREALLAEPAARHVLERAGPRVAGTRRAARRARGASSSRRRAG
jgi:hypothetical protein